MQSTQQRCAVGCLRCNSTSFCQFCDTTSNFYLNNGVCVNVTRSNCDFADQNGNCVLCSEGTYLDVMTRTCLPVPVNRIQPNCLIHTSSMGCDICKKEFVAVSGKCVAVSTSITNCWIYNSLTECRLCQVGYIISPFNSTQCVALPTTASNCVTYSYLTCRKCKDNFILASQRSYEWLISSDEDNIILGILNSPLLYQINYGTSFATKVCYPKSFGCDPAKNELCLGCDVGQYLDKNQCKKNPDPRIENCMAYSNLLTCSKCMNQYFLEANVCKAVVPIVNCINYDGSASATICVECKDGFFVFFNACVERTIKDIKNCVKYNLSADECLSCDVASMITTQKLGCLFTVDYCTAYASTAVDATFHNCNQCKDGYYPNTVNSQKICAKGTVSFCQTYNQNDNNKCTVCLNGYYLVDSMCKQHVNIDNCNTYDQSVAHRCQTCESGFIRLSFNKVCVRGTPIANCLTALTDLSGCSICKPRFFLNASTLGCDPIPLALGNCVTSNADGSSCLTCADGQILFKYPTYSTCLSPPDFISTYGFVASSLTKSQYDVTSSSLIGSDGLCADFSYPVKLQFNDGVCVKTSQLKFVYPFNIISGCRRYSWNVAKTSMFCSECNEGLYIIDYSDLTGLTGDLRCSDTCDLSTNFVILNDLLGIYNVCVPRSTINWPSTGLSNTNCNIAVRNQITTAGVTWNALSYSKTLKCLAYDDSTTVAVWNSFDLSSYVFDIDLVNSGNAYNTNVQFLGYHISDRKPKPFAFNYAGYLTTPAFKSAVFIPALVSNCNLFFEMKSGSAYAAVFRDVNLITMSTAKKDLVCLQCQFGFVPTFSEKMNSQWVYAPKCNPFVGDLCNKSVVSGGLPSYLNAVLSCHSCLNNFVPRVRFEILWSSIFGLSGTGSPALNKGWFLQYTFDTTVNPFTCHNPAIPVPLFDINNPSTTTNTNCGVYGDISRLDDVEKVAIETSTFCLACKHGYSPFYFQQNGVTVLTASIPNYIVTTCSQILNCDLNSLNKPFNSCGKCLAQQTVATSGNPFFAFADLLLRKCDASKSSFCFVLKPSSVDCLICQAGYYLNREGYCDAIVLPNIQESASFNYAVNLNGLRTDLLDPLLVAQSTSNPGYNAALAKAKISESVYIRLQLLLSNTNLPNGPTLCRSGYTITPLPLNVNSICVFSPLLKANTLTTTTYFIQNCQRYFNSMSVGDTPLLCFKCFGSFVVTDDFTKCVNTIANCNNALSSDTTLCQICIKGFSNLNGVCVNSKIDKCATYTPTEDKSPATEITCNECVDEFYWNVNLKQCLRDPLLNCLKFRLGYGPECVKCLNGYALGTPKGQLIAVCVAIRGMYDNCNTLTTGNNPLFAGGFISCDKCNYSDTDAYSAVSTTLLITTNNPRNMCIRYNNIENCVVYDITNTGFVNSSLNCLECAPGFYVNLNICIKRTVAFEGCAEYSKTTDTCLSCAPGLIYQSSYFPQCIQNPKGVPKCTKYFDALTCVKCENGYYLSNNLCLLSTVLSDCVEYSNNYTCRACRSAYFLNSTGGCQTTNATNCETIASVTACASCAVGKGLKKEIVESVELTNCVDIVIADCMETSKVFPFKCLICNPNYYLSTEACVLVDPLIANCLYYETATLCSQCSPRHSLSVDKKKCEDESWVRQLSDEDCVKMETLVSPVCSMCRPGYTMSNNVCVPLLRENPLCIALDSQSRSVCMLCQPKKSWMNAKGFCVSVDPVTIFVPSYPASEFMMKTVLVTLLFALMTMK